MATQIDKKQTLDIADGIARDIWQAYKGIQAPSTHEYIWIRDIIEEGLNSWISDCESEDAEYRKYENQ